MNCAEIEEVYLRSTFIAECGLVPSLEPGGHRWHAVVVPNMTLMRQRRIANVGDLLRFEIEGQSVYLPPDMHVTSYEIWFDSLPRTSAGAIDRQELERRVGERRRRSERLRERPVTTGFSPRNEAEAEAVAIVAARAKRGEVTPESNLEIDLGLDSIDRVELISELEKRFGTTLAAESAHDILTVGQLVEAVRPTAVSDHPGTVPDAPFSFWKTQLRDLPQRSDPVLASVLERRVVVPTLFFVLLRLARWLMPRMKVSGVNRLPVNGPYILTPNHQSYLDPLFVCSALPYRMFRQIFFVGATEYFETPLTAWAARQLNLVPVDPDANLISALRAAAFGLKHGKVLVLFPEGERSIDGTVKRFKKGAPILSRSLAAPIVPVAIRGVFEVWPRNRSFEWRRILPWSGHRIAVAFGEPTTFDDSSAADAAMALQKRVAELWASMAPSPKDSEHGSASETAGKKNT
jgi:long-chain acyl-CoA synthetase